jgi:putative glycerol-1-phosphate prenyltransferase
MKKQNVLSLIQSNQQSGKKMLAILIDPDKVSIENLPNLIIKINQSKTNLLFVGGSLLFKNSLDQFVKTIKSLTNLPVVLFPGSAIQISNEADSLLFLQLISGRNPEFLISNQVVAAPLLKQTNLEVISTGYILVESGRETTASYISNTKPIPAHKPEIAMATALAGEYIGQKLIYLDGGSGALQPVPTETIKKVNSAIDLPIIVGGGIKNKQQMQDAFNAGATVVVIGTAFENNNDLLTDF